MTVHFLVNLLEAKLGHIVFHYETHREKNGFLPRGNREADQRLCFRHSDSTISLLPNSEISRL